MMKRKKHRDDIKKFGFRRKIHEPFPRFAVVVVVINVTFFDEILRNFHDCLSECVSFPKKNDNQFWEVSVFPKK